jgi:malonate-semialdehyde dehydrogenase (acetylating)/methylmalonate-semialdehyde dehydrogenase
MRGLEVVEHAVLDRHAAAGRDRRERGHGVDVYNIYQPLGVGGITAFNFPVMLPCFMFPIAIACGNAFVLKPSSRTRLDACSWSS